MEAKTYDSMGELFADLSEYGSIHIECNREMSEELLAYMTKHKKGADSSFLTALDRGYEASITLDRAAL